MPNLSVYTLYVYVFSTRRGVSSNTLLFNTAGPGVAYTSKKFQAKFDYAVEKQKLQNKGPDFCKAALETLIQDSRSSSSFHSSQFG